MSAPTTNAAGAAEILGCHRETVLDKARKGEIPGAKIGRRWVFVVADLVAAIRARYPDVESQPNEAPRWNSRDAADKASTTSASPRRTDREYTAALGLPTRSRRRNSRTV